MNLYTVPFYRHAPFLRIVIPFTTGILLQFHLHLPIGVLWALLAIFTLSATFTLWPGAGALYGLVVLRGVLLHFSLAAFGAICLFYGIAGNRHLNLQHHYQPGAIVVLRLLEPLSERAGSYRTTASVSLIHINGGFKKCTGTILVYLEKNPENLKLRYGDQLITSAAIQPIATTGNPAAFDYRQYCSLQGIYHQVFLAGTAYRLTGQHDPGRFKSFLFRSRLQVITLLKKNIPGAKEAGLAGALLIGVKDELDRELVQTYSNTGVVHVIAISGLHLGLIYAILVISTTRLTRFRGGIVARLLLILAGIWIFSLLAGGSPSVVRSAVMFSCIAIGNAISKSSSIYNSLAASAFLLLAYNPLWLWDTGFQLSYAAVLSIVIFQKRVQALIYPRNRLLILLWQTCAVTIAAQILTTPVSMFYFHQFPILFLLTNFVAIPLSSLILIMELILCMLSPFPIVAKLTGLVCQWLIMIMNSFVEWVNGLPHANWAGLQIDKIQFILLFMMIAGFDGFLRRAGESGRLRILAPIAIGLFSLLGFFAARCFSFYEAERQQKLIVYNIPKHSAIEFIRGRSSFFVTDTALAGNEQQMRFHILPSRILHRIKHISLVGDGVGKTQRQQILLQRTGFRVVRITAATELRVKVNVLIISGNPAGSLSKLVRGTQPALIVFDCSNSRTRINNWLRECHEAGLTAWSVPDRGAFVMKMN